MKNATVAASVALMFVLSACVTPPERTDPLSEISIVRRPPPPPAYPNLSVALVLSPDSKSAIAYMQEFNAHLFRSNFWPSAHFDASKVFTTLTDMLSRHFKSLTKVDSVSQASGVDLVAVLDVFARVAPPPFSKTTQIDTKIIFLTPDGTQVDAMSSHGEIEIPKERSDTKLYAAAESARDKLEEALVASTALRAVARSVPSAQAEAAPAQESRPQPAHATPHSEVDRPSYQLPESPRDFALVVGIENYENLPPADYAERDAAAVRDHLLALGYPQRNVIYLTGSQASRTGIEKYVESWLPKNVGEDSQVFVYFSGHGAPDVASGQAYLVPWDGDAKFLENTGYPIKRLYEHLNSLKARRVLVAMDACFSGAGGRSVLAKGARPLVTKTDLGAADVKNVVVLAAAGADEITSTDEKQGHGVFTYQLLKALNETKGDGTVQALFDAVLPRVQDEARRDNRDQTPQLLPPDLGEHKSLKFR